MASSFIQSFIDPKKNWFAAQHMKAISKRLRRFGLRYDDLYDPYYDLDVKEALNRLPKEVVDARHQRLKRAMDLSMKHEYLPEDLQLRFRRSVGTTVTIYRCNCSCGLPFKTKVEKYGNANTIQGIPSGDACPCEEGESGA
ncbi:hypothetical protein Ahy_B06g085527 [Arachis hypogaea]|uniref:Complex III subunit VII n=1 Tax=Arachis hypogaea TaxID=3818 RepID=A0A444YUV0_ARAHY|nr:hypothetical protein Ahy_B06g085527 [Arachis hypogaea]